VFRSGYGGGCSDCATGPCSRTSSMTRAPALSSLMCGRSRGERRRCGRCARRARRARRFDHDDGLRRWRGWISARLRGCSRRTLRGWPVRYPGGVQSPSAVPQAAGTSHHGRSVSTGVLFEKWSRHPQPRRTPVPFLRPPHPACFRSITLPCFWKSWECLWRADASYWIPDSAWWSRRLNSSASYDNGVCIRCGPAK
jgi:hypothetical protein